jgi:hypothetical protein
MGPLLGHSVLEQFILILINDLKYAFTYQNQNKPGYETTGLLTYNLVTESIYV